MDIDEFNCMAGWADNEVIIYVKRLLKGSALQFVRAQRNVYSWQKLKKILIEEYAIETNNAEVHQQLNARAKRASETCREYLYPEKNSECILTKFEVLN